MSYQDRLAIENGLAEQRSQYEFDMDDANMHKRQVGTFSKEQDGVLLTLLENVIAKRIIRKLFVIEY